jgi:predicted dehydrogenase
VDVAPRPVPKNLDWDLYCGPSPLKPFHPPRVGGTHRGYWDYEGGGLGDMGQHYLDPLTWLFGRDHTAPVEVEASAPPAHGEVAGMWAWAKLTYADGFTLVLESGEWGQPTGLKSKGVKLEDLDEEGRKKLKELPDPQPLVDFGEAVRTRKQPGGHPEAAHRTATIMHLANIAIRTGRKIRFDPVKEEAVGDDAANRLVNPPMRAPWRL